MTHFVKNYDSLAQTPERTAALQIIEAAYGAIETDAAIHKKVVREGSELRVDGTTYDLSRYRRVFVVGAGKVACRAAATIEEILKDKLSSGSVIGTLSHVCEIVDTYIGTHPKPSAANFAASAQMVEIGREATEDDLVIAIIGGGGSSLLCSSERESEQQGALYDAFLRTGGTIDELNLVRKHLSELKGGGLAKILYPATVIGLIFSDVSSGKAAMVASGPTYRDETTVADAQAIIDRYNLGEFTLSETPKEEKYFVGVHNTVLVSNADALEAMAAKARELGYALAVAETDPYGAAQEVVKGMYERARPGTAVLYAGEPRLVVPDDCKGSGGRNSLLALLALGPIQNSQVFAAFASDGHDNGERAGALVDTKTKEHIDELNIDVAERIRCLDSGNVFEQTGDYIDTGLIEANVSDLYFLLTAHE